MTEKDLLIQEYRREIKELVSALDTIIESHKLCRYCTKVLEDCTPTDCNCKPESIFKEEE